MKLFTLVLCSRHARHAAAVVLAVLLLACGGGGGGGGAPAPVPPPAPTPKAWTGATLIETDNASDAATPRIALDASGNAVAVWRHYDGTRENIWANRFTPSTGWGTATLIETDDAGDASGPQLAMNANGTAIAVWVQSDGTHYNLWANRFTPSTGWGTATLIETDDANVSSTPYLAVDASGNAVAVWTLFDGTRANIWANRYSAGNSTWGTAALLETDAGDTFSPRIAMDANGNAMAVWAQFDGTRYNLWASRYSASSAAWGTPQLVEADNAGSVGGAQVALDASGNAVAVWNQSDGTRRNIWANRFTPSTGWGTATLIETDDVGDAAGPQVSVDASGNAIAVWHQYDGTRDNIRANRYNASTSAWGRATPLIQDGTAGAYSPRFALDASGNAIAVWEQSDGVRTDVWANRYNASTSTWGAAVLLETDNTGDAYGAHIAMDASGNAIAIWQQWDGTRYNIWANAYR